MNARSFPHPELERIKLHDILFALSDPTRLSLAATLADGSEWTPGDLAGSIPKSTMSHHLRILREAGITRTRSEGMRCYVSLRREDLETRFPGLLDSVLRHLRSAGPDGP